MPRLVVVCRPLNPKRDENLGSTRKIDPVQRRVGLDDWKVFPGDLDVHDFKKFGELATGMLGLLKAIVLAVAVFFSLAVLMALVAPYFAPPEARETVASIAAIAQTAGEVFATGVLPVVIGVFGTVLGFYFGSEK